MEIALGTLKDKGEELASFLEPRVGVRPTVSGNSLEIEDASLRKGVRPRHVKTYIKRFMYMKGLKKNYRVFIAGKELTVQEIELGEEEEKEEKQKPKEPDDAKKALAEAKQGPAPVQSEEPKAEKKQTTKKSKPRKKTESQD